MANQFGYPTTDDAAQRILDGRAKAIAGVQEGEGHQIELMSLELGMAIAAYRRLHVPATTPEERAELQRWKDNGKTRQRSTPQTPQPPEENR